VIGRYLLCDAIASGGAATVHIARLIGPEGFSRTVAIKRLHAQFARNPEFVSMFLDEARLASRIHHPNVVSPQDIVVLEDELLIVMEYVHGESLSRIVKALGEERMPVPVAVAIVSQVLLGLQAAHEAASPTGEPLELVHRDVSPQNVLLGEDGVARLVDFGIAKARNKIHHTDSGMVKGKPGYMAPEQVTAGELDRRTDVFAAGIVLWELLTGARLFRGETPNAAVQKILKQEIVPPSQLVVEIPPDLDHIVLTALARNPEERFQNARAMALALTTVVPPAGTLEVATWMSRICGAMLRQRADRLSELEAVPLEELTQGLPVRSRLAPLVASPPERSHRVGPFASVAEARATATPERAVLPLETPSRASRRRPRAVTMSAAAVLLGISALGTTFLARRGESSEPALQAVPIEATTSARSPETVVAAQSPVSVLAASPSAVEADAELDRGGAAAAPQRGVATAVLPRAAALPPVRRQAATPRARAAGSARTSAPSSADRSSRTCALPFFLDRRGTKRFNPECF
jgi:serine/threonine-protein kinase